MTALGRWKQALVAEMLLTRGQLIARSSGCRAPRATRIVNPIRERGGSNRLYGVAVELDAPSQSLESPLAKPGALLSDDSARNSVGLSSRPARLKRAGV
jgi:hypothetical protein